MRQIRSIFFSLLTLVCIFIYPEPYVSAQDTGAAQKQGAEIIQLNAEDEEIVRNLEVLENLDWLVDIDIDLLENLDLFLTNT